jgi:hypothetical protein
MNKDYGWYHSRYHTPITRQRSPKGYLPDGCAYQLASVLAVLAAVLLVALAVHPQGIPLIPWLFNQR